MADSHFHTPTPQRRERLLWAAPAAIVLTFALVGCYTILQHPITAGDNQEQAYHQEFYREQCIDCHADYAEYPYGFFYSDYPDYYFENPRWGHYYAYPWWWDRYWYDNRGPVTDDDRAGADPSSKAGRRGALAPPYVGGSPALPTGGSSYTAPSTPGAKGGTATGNEPANTVSKGSNVYKKKSGQTDASKPNPDSTDQSDQRRKANRRGGIDP
jgi:hypothetical protein